MIEEMGGRGILAGRQGDWLKWLRYFLDFCGKYGHGPREEESVGPFLQKLASKGQSGNRQAEAAKCLGLFFEVVARFRPPRERNKEGAQAKAEGWEGCFTRLTGVMKVRHYSPKTLKSYTGWIRRFRKFLASKDPASIDMDDVSRYLTYLAVERSVSASTQNQAFNALLFLFRHVLEKPFEVGKNVVRARRRRYVPVVLSRAEVDRVVAEIDPAYRLLALLLYGCGLRVAEALNLRIQCLNFDQGVLTVRRGKGGKDRTLPLPRCLTPELQAHREEVRAQFERDLENARFAGTFVPSGSDRKWESRAREWIWQFCFPAKTLTLVSEEERYRRCHLHETDVGDALRAAARKARLDKRVTAHTMRHTFASHLLLANYDIRTIQEMMGHSDVRTTMIYTQTVPSRTLKERRSPLDMDAADIDPS